MNIEHAAATKRCPVPPWPPMEVLVHAGATLASSGRRDVRTWSTRHQVCLTRWFSRLPCGCPNPTIWALDGIRTCSTSVILISHPFRLSLFGSGFLSKKARGASTWQTGYGWCSMMFVQDSRDAQDAAKDLDGSKIAGKEASAVRMSGLMGRRLSGQNNMTLIMPLHMKLGCYQCKWS